MICLAKKINPVVTKLFIRGRKLNITQCYFVVPKNVRLNSTRYFSTNRIIIIHLILVFKTLWIFTKKILKHHIHF